MSKRHCIFTENFAIFISNAGKTGHVPKFEFDTSGRTSFEDDINVTFHKFYPMKRSYLSERIPYLA